MWQRFSEQARQAILVAQQEAQARGSEDVDTEHLLLALLLQGGRAGGVILREAGASAEAVRALLPPACHAPDATEARLTASSKRVLELTAQEALSLRHNFIGTGHMAIALSLANGGGATPILQGLGVTTEALRARFDSLPQAHQHEAPPCCAHTMGSGNETFSQRIITRMVRWMGGE